MSISRRDTILISILVNVALLTVIFLTATRVEEEGSPLTPPSQSAQIVVAEPVSAPVQRVEVASDLPVDEVEKVLQEYVQNPAPTEIKQPEPIASLDPVTENTLQITVKKGDSLDKIARANRTSIEEIRTLNKLNSDRLSIGQLLRIPSPKPGKQTPASLPIAENKTSSEAVYYTVKSGDNPWKIARQFNVKYEDILRLNSLDEQKARNLKVGDRIRIK